ncbi:isoform 2 of f-box/lrr-repeat protein [Fagus crenata]
MGLINIKKKKRRRGLSSGKDYISELPDDILSFIFSHLRLRDAVKTSVLSHRWGRVSASKSKLKFFWRNMFLTNENDKNWGFNKDPCREDVDKFVKSVNQFLKFHGDWNKWQIVSLEVLFCLGNDYKNDIDEWIRYAIGMGAEKLSLLLSAENGEQIDKYVCHRELLSQGTECKLKTLGLGGCVLEPPNSFFSQFSCLETLILCYTSLGLNEVQSIFYGCSNLKVLRLKHCSLPVKLSIRGSLRYLRSLLIDSCVGVEELELKLAEDLPVLRNIAIVVEPSIDQLCVPKSITGMTIFRKVTKWKLFFTGDMEFNILEMTFILQAFPVLQEFCLGMNCPVDFNHCRKPEPKTFVQKHLKKVQIEGFRGTPNQIDFVIYLVKHAIALKKMVIDPVYLQGNRKAWDEGERERVSEQLQEYSRDVVLIMP